jgi:predicted N-acetyltransferase YhbS
MTAMTTKVQENLQDNHLLDTPRIVPATKPFAIRLERANDVAARDALLDACFGADRKERACQRIRDSRLAARGLSFSAVRQGTFPGKLVGTIRLWHVNAGDRASLMLGPLAVDPALRDLGIGAALMRHSIEAAAARGHDSIILVGDAPYYKRFGFAGELMVDLDMNGAFERERLLGLELKDGALQGARGMIVPTGVMVGDRLVRPPRKTVARAA